jgi:hypothetical protein
MTFHFGYNYSEGGYSEETLESSKRGPSHSERLQKLSMKDSWPVHSKVSEQTGAGTKVTQAVITCFLLLALLKRQV